jgi:Cu2+-exporting ATPase
MNVRSPIVVTVTAAGEATRLGSILRLVQAAAQDRPQIVQWADRAGGWFVAVVIVLAIATLSGWWIAGSDRAVDHAVALLIVACPCALALATPLTLSVALGRAAGHGIMIKGGNVLARLAQPGRIWLDKTGTLTAGRMRVVRWDGDEKLLPVVAAIQSHSKHPLADAFSLESGPAPVLDASEVRQVTGLGIEGTVADRRYQIGSEKFMEALGIAIERRWNESANAIVGEGLSPVFVSEDRKIRAVVGVGDPVRQEAAGLVQRLKDSGWRVGILSGDHPATVQCVARHLGIDSEMALGRLSPEDKVRHLRSETDDLPTIMVGDGVNDSPALAAADVGIAVHSGAHASLQAAPVWLARSGIGEIADLLDASKHVMRTIQIAVFASLFYNIVAVVLAAAGLIHPLVAAALMPLSSLTVVALAIAGKSFGKKSL